MKDTKNKEEGQQFETKQNQITNKCRKFRNRNETNGILKRNLENNNKTKKHEPLYSIHYTP